MPQSKTEAPWGRSTVETACPLDCPDSCSLAVTVQNGRVQKIDGSTRQPLTGGYICAKVRRFGERVYGDDRLQHPAVRSGRKGSGKFQRVSWDEALDRIASEMLATRDKWGAEAILPFYYGGSNGLLSQGTADFALFRAFRTSRLARTVCAAPTGAAAMAMYGKMPGVGYSDYPKAQLVVVWGANPATSGIHLVPYIQQAQRAGAMLVVVDPRRTTVAKKADLHLAPRPGTDVVVALAVHRYLFEEGHADLEFLARHTRGAERLRERAREWTFERAAEVSGVPADLIRTFAEAYASRSPAVIRCGWGLERNRNGGNGVMAVLALPAVAGKFGVAGGGYTMSNSGAWRLDADAWAGEPEAPTRLVNMNHLGRALLEYDAPPVRMLFVYNCNPVATMPDQNRVIRGLEREDLFTVVFDQVATDTVKYADVVLPATTFLEGYDITRGYGALSLQLAQPVIEPVGEARSNLEVFSELLARVGLRDSAQSDLDQLLPLLDRLPAGAKEALLEGRAATPPFGAAPVQFGDVAPWTRDGKVDLFPEALEAEGPIGLYRYQPEPGGSEYPLTLISPASQKTVSSTLGELRHQTASLDLHPDDAAARAIEDGDTVRIHNALGSVECYSRINPDVRPGTVALPKGLWRKSTLNGSTVNALVPDTLTDLGAGACFNDARVEVVKIVSAALESQGAVVSLEVGKKRVH